MVNCCMKEDDDSDLPNNIKWPPEFISLVIGVLAGRRLYFVSLDVFPLFWKLELEKLS